MDIALALQSGWVSCELPLQDRAECYDRSAYGEPSGDRPKPVMVASNASPGFRAVS